MITAMPVLVAAFALLLALTPGAPSRAQPFDAGADAAGETATVAEPGRAEKLDALFETLKSAASTDEAETAEREILGLWSQSGSDTIDLLMAWTAMAIDDEDYPHALDLLDRITTQKPDFAEGWNRRATVYYLTDDYGRSIADIERVLALEPRHFGALSGLGTMLREMGEDERAIEAYEWALAIDPHLENVSEALAQMQGTDGDRDL